MNIHKNIIKYAMASLLLLVWGGNLPCAYATLSQTAEDGNDFNPPSPPDPNSRYRLTTTTDGFGYASGAGDYMEGQQVYVYTSARSDSYYFINWTCDGKEVSTERSFEFTMPAHRVTLIAHYGFNPPNPNDPEAVYQHRLYLTTNEKDNCSFNTPSGSKVKDGSEVWLYAYLSQGYTFVGWYLNGEKISSEQSFYFTMPKEDTTLEARVEYNPSNPSDPSGGKQDNTDNDGKEDKPDSGNTDKPDSGNTDKPSGDEGNKNQAVVNGETYKISPDKNTAELESSSDASYIGNYEIPSTITWEGKEYTITSLADGCFKGKKDLKSVKIPATITELGKDLFKDSGVEWISFEAANPPILTGALNVPIYVWPENVDAFKNEASYASESINPIFSLEGTSMDENQTIQMTPPVFAKEELKPSDVTWKWSCSDDKIATVSTSGKVKALQAGTVDITAELVSASSQAAAKSSKTRASSISGHYVTCTLTVLTAATGIKDIDATSDSEVSYYRLDGTFVGKTPGKGIYIKVDNHSKQKVLIP